MIKKDNTKLTIEEQCELASVNRRSLYFKPREESIANKELMNRIDELFTLRL